MSSTLLKRLGISSPQEAADLELDLGIRFNDLTPQQCETWQQQSIYLYQYARTRTFTHAVKAAGVSLRTARTWQTDNTLGFNQRLELAVLEYSEDIEVLLLERARQPDSPPTFLSMLLRAQLPEKYGPARRYNSAPARDNHSERHDIPEPEPSDNDDDSLEDIRQDIQNLNQFAGLTEPDLVPQPNAANLSPTGKETQRGGAPSESPAPFAVNRHTPPNRHTGGGRYPEASRPYSSESDQEIASLYDAEDTTPHDIEEFAHSPQNPTPSTQNLTRRQRRELQRQSKRKHKKSHPPRAPN